MFALYHVEKDFRHVFSIPISTSSLRAAGAPSLYVLVFRAQAALHKPRKRNVCDSGDQIRQELNVSDITLMNVRVSISFINLA